MVSKSTGFKTAFLGGSIMSLPELLEKDGDQRSVCGATDLDFYLPLGRLRQAKQNKQPTKPSSMKPGEAMLD